jgi:hypothetical protein
MLLRSSRMAVASYAILERPTVRASAAGDAIAINLHTEQVTDVSDVMNLSGAGHG